MESVLKLSLLISFVSFLSGCVSNSVIGFYGDGEVISGKVNHNLMLGGGSFTVSSVSGKICEGSADAPDRGVYSLDWSDQSGLGRGTCNDGTEFSFRWNAVSGYRSAIASGMDSNGEKMCVVMGESTQKVTDLIRSGSVDDTGYCRDILVETNSVNVEVENNTYFCRSLGKRKSVLKLTKDSQDMGSVIFGDEKVSAIYSTEGLDVRWDWGGKDYNKYAVIVGIDGIARYYSWVGVEKSWINPTGSTKPASVFECDKT